MTTGLTSEQARQRLAQHGPNALPGIKRRSALGILLHQFAGVVALLLGAAAAVSLLRGDVIEAIAIAAVLILNAAIGFAVEMRSRTALEALQSHLVPRARVVRDGSTVNIDAREVVPDDVLVLEAGDGVAADAELFTASELQVTEAALTGESLPVDKDADWNGPADTPLAERRNMVYAGTTVLNGSARALVVNTGTRTEVGKIGELAGAVETTKSPLERSVDELGKKLILATGVILVIIVAINWLRGVPLSQTIDMALALAVAVMPEGLPAVVTITLALGMQRMARRRALMRRMHAVEALGSTTIVCTDKTGTLTTGHVTMSYAFVDGRKVEISEAGQAIRAALIAGGVHGSGDPIDLAIADAAQRVGDVEGADDHAGDVPFSSTRRFSASFRRATDGSLTAYVKGAPRVLLEMCELTEEARTALMAANERFASDGIRVIAVAQGRVAAAEEQALRGLVFSGLLGFRDPPAAGVRDAVAALHTAGIRTVMITGDQKLTAQAIAREIGNIGDVFSRVDPEQKLRIVEKYQREGETVAVFGDGVNDAAALRRADVGVAMGRGTDVAKQAAAVVLEDDSFATIVAAVREGRVIFDNIGKFVFYLFSCNLAELLVILAAAVIGLPLPLLPLQILWLNLVTDTFPALALAVEPGAPDVMARPPRRPEEGIVSRAMAIRILGFSVVIAAVTLVAFVLSKSTTTAFVVLGIAQVLHLGNARSREHVLSLKAMRSNRAALAGASVSLALLMVAIYFEPLSTVLGAHALSGRELMQAAAIAAVPAVLGQLFALLNPHADRTRARIDAERPGR